MTETDQDQEDQEEQNKIKYPTVDSSHITLDIELSRFSLNGEDIILHDWAEGTMLYKAVGTTTSVEEAVSHDGPAIQNGRYVSFNRNSDEPDLAFTSHPMAGTQDHYQITDELDTHIVLLSELERNPVEK